MQDRESNLKLVLICAQFRVTVVAQTTFCPTVFYWPISAVWEVDFVKIKL
jgi:hypothetical protein